MAINIVCPNGHALRIKDKYAGKTRRCPVCKAVIEVPPKLAYLVKDPVESPAPDESGLSGLNLLSPDSGGKPADGSPGIKDMKDTRSEESKICAKCCKEIPKSAKVCPHCGGFIESLEQ